MESLIDYARRGGEAVKRLRVAELRRGEPFMISPPELPKDQCYLEYPDGSIRLATFNRSSGRLVFLQELSLGEIETIRRQFNLDLNWR